MWRGRGRRGGRVTACRRNLEAGEVPQWAREAREPTWTVRALFGVVCFAAWTGAWSYDYCSRNQPHTATEPAKHGPLTRFAQVGAEFCFSDEPSREMLNSTAR